MLDRKGEDPQVLDVRQLSGVTSYHVLVSGNSTPHLKALAEETEIALKHDGERCYRKSGTAASGWILLDYVDVVLHVMTDETRAYYDLEQLWSDAPRVAIVHEEPASDKKS